MSVGGGHKHPLFTPPPGLPGDGQRAMHGTDRARQGELANEDGIFEPGQIDFFARRQPCRWPLAGRSSAPPFLIWAGARFTVQRPCGIAVTAVRDGGGDPVTAFLHGGVRHSHHHHVGFAARHVDLDFDFISINTENRGGENFCQHVLAIMGKNRPVCKVAQPHLPRISYILGSPVLRRPGGGRPSTS